MTRTRSSIGPYGMVPLWLLEAGVSHRAVYLYALLAAKWADRDTGECWPSRRTLAQMAECSVATLDRALSELVKLGALTVHSQIRFDGGQRSNLYRVEFNRPSPTRPPLLTGEAPPSSPTRPHELEPEEPEEPLVVSADAAPTREQPKRWSDDARQVASTVWDRFKAEQRTPNAAKWEGVATVAQAMLDVGHSPERIGAAIMRARVCTVPGVLFELGSQSTGTGGAAPPVVSFGCELCHDGWIVPAEGADLTVHPCPSCRPDPT